MRKLPKDFPHKPPGFPSDYTDEEYIASGLLSGYCNIDSKGRFLGVLYLTGTHEKLGFEMLARVLRNKKGPPRQLLRDLAELFDPESENPRKLKFKFRSRKPPTPYRDRAMTDTTSIAVNRTLPQRLPNSTYRPREYLTETEVDRLIGIARKHGRNGPRDAAAICVQTRTTG